MLHNKKMLNFSIFLKEKKPRLLYHMYVIIKIKNCDVKLKKYFLEIL